MASSDRALVTPLVYGNDVVARVQSRGHAYQTPHGGWFKLASVKNMYFKFRKDRLAPKGEMNPTIAMICSCYCVFVPR